MNGDTAVRDVCPALPADRFRAPAIAALDEEAALLVDAWTPPVRAARATPPGPPTAPRAGRSADHA
ncbi:hypothetical protein [Kitasatospora purpeofusca]|uniref:hypothetical protein n=1 Tax=Kitasatospora purpeofusca TaxID=67352 RepID=UPI0036D428E1